MALNNHYRATDKELMFSAAQALTVTTATYSTNELDLGSAAMAQGEAIRGIIQVSGYSATAASTLAIVVASATTTAATTTIMTIPTITGTAAVERFFTLPADCPRYVRLNYTLGATAASSVNITALLTAEVLK